MKTLKTPPPSKKKIIRNYVPLPELHTAPALSCLCGIFHSQDCLYSWCHFHFWGCLHFLGCHHLLGRLHFWGCHHFLGHLHYFVVIIIFWIVLIQIYLRIFHTFIHFFSDTSRQNYQQALYILLQRHRKQGQAEEMEQGDLRNCQGGGHIKTFAPLYKSESPTQVGTLTLKFLLQNTDKNTWSDVYL